VRHRPPPESTSDRARALCTTPRVIRGLTPQRRSGASESGSATSRTVRFDSTTSAASQAPAGSTSGRAIGTCRRAAGAPAPPGSGGESGGAGWARPLAGATTASASSVTAATRTGAVYLLVRGCATPPDGGIVAATRAAEASCFGRGRVARLDDRPARGALTSSHPEDGHHEL